MASRSLPVGPLAVGLRRSRDGIDPRTPNRGEHRNEAAVRPVCQDRAAHVAFPDFLIAVAPSLPSAAELVARCANFAGHLVQCRTPPNVEGSLPRRSYDGIGPPPKS